MDTEFQRLCTYTKSPLPRLIPSLQELAYWSIVERNTKIIRGRKVVKNCPDLYLVPPLRNWSGYALEKWRFHCLSDDVVWFSGRFSAVGDGFCSGWALTEVRSSDKFEVALAGHVIHDSDIHGPCFKHPIIVELGSIGQVSVITRSARTITTFVKLKINIESYRGLDEFRTPMLNGTCMLYISGYIGLEKNDNE